MTNSSTSGTSWSTGSGTCSATVTGVIEQSLGPLAVLVTATVAGYGPLLWRRLVHVTVKSTLIGMLVPADRSQPKPAIFTSARAMAATLNSAVAWVSLSSGAGTCSP